jgi:hypothetical protein
MSKDNQNSRDLKLLLQNDYDLMVQYNELLCLRAELARWLYPLKTLPPRKYRPRPRNRSAARTARRNEGPASYAPILLLIQERPQT